MMNKKALIILFMVLIALFSVSCKKSNVGIPVTEIIGVWNFRVSFLPETNLNLPELWRFTFNNVGEGEVWLYDERKNSYDFDGRNIRFPCHYYLEPSTGSALHLLFLGYMDGRDSISGDLYNDVGGSGIIGVFEANRLPQ